MWKSNSLCVCFVALALSVNATLSCWLLVKCDQLFCWNGLWICWPPTLRCISRLGFWPPLKREIGGVQSCSKLAHTACLFLISLKNWIESHFVWCFRHHSHANRIIIIKLGLYPSRTRAGHTYSKPVCIWECRHQGLLHEDMNQMTKFAPKTDYVW